MPSRYASLPVRASFPCEHLTIAAGVAIFHLATERVVLCYHTRDKTWFLPKGRRNANEDTARAAEREGYEESGYRNRLLPLPLRHRQPDPGSGPEPFVTEPVWTQLLQLTERTQYMLFWYIAETIPPDIERIYAEGRTSRSGYRSPPPFSGTSSLQARIEEDVTMKNGNRGIYEPVRHEGTGVDDEERLYRAYLLSVDEACERLRGTVMEDVVLRGQAAIQLRKEMEAEQNRR
ncbi:hypothetical protein B0A50_06754 [Lecanosticta acicola]|uniref:Nudix hydrolase domain-containing protein n=1 Tax=Lecanosticta acicola TaxID=111012 RepID=A0AAI9ECS3_9PEZI|nr:hypothetical protein B0A50_06754 [Lecanosticta acicola]